MTVHLVKMAVGIDSLDQLRKVQRARLARKPSEGGTGDLRHFTRNRPRRDAEVLDGGCIHWIIKGYIRVRQRIIGFDEVMGQKGRKRCAIILDPRLEQTELVPHKPIQGWRYMEDEAAPSLIDLRKAKAEASLPQELADELRTLGLL
jgi:hypothetical protein